VLIDRREKATGPETYLEVVEVEANEDPVKAATERIGLVRRVVAQIAARRQVLAMVLFPDFVMSTN